MKTNRVDEKDGKEEKDKIDQPAVTKSDDSDFPKEYEEQRSEKIRMKPQPLAQPEKGDGKS